MRLFKQIVLFSAVIAAPFAMADINSQLLINKWQCKFALSEEGMTMRMNNVVTYRDDGSSKLNGQMDINIDMMNVDLSYQVNAEGQWEVQENYIMESIVEFDAVSLKPSEMDAVMMDNLLPKDQTNASEIIELSADMLKLKDASGQIVSCVRSNL